VSLRNSPEFSNDDEPQETSPEVAVTRRSAPRNPRRGRDVNEDNAPAEQERHRLEPEPHRVQLRLITVLAIALMATIGGIVVLQLSGNSAGNVLTPTVTAIVASLTGIAACRHTGDRRRK
jgi:hypothetical protein